MNATVQRISECNGAVAGCNVALQPAIARTSRIYTSPPSPFFLLQLFFPLFFSQLSFPSSSFPFFLLFSFDLLLLSMILRLTNCRLCDKGALISGDLYIDTASGKITKPTSDATSLDLGGKIVAPGYIDIQNNGVYGVNFSTLDPAADQRRLRRALARYLRTGVTAMCPTVTSSAPHVYHKVVPLYARTRAADRTDSLGAHLEGPFISRKKKGCHPENTFVDAEKELFAAIYGNISPATVAIITAAPEVPGVLAQFENAAAHGIVCSVGHSAADHATALAAVRHGASMVTHLYNAMPQPHHRQAGVVGLVTAPETGRNSPYFGLICDGVHVAPSMCVLAYRANPEKCVLVTDTMHLFGLPDGTYDWDGQRIEKRGSALRLQGTDTLAGAATDLPTGVRNLMRWTGASLAQAVRTVTNNAADSLNIRHKGYLDEGCDADLVVLDDEANVCEVFKLGVAVAPDAVL